MMCQLPAAANVTGSMTHKTCQQISEHVAPAAALAALLLGGTLQQGGSSARSTLSARYTCCSCHATVHSLDFAMPQWQPCCRWCPVLYTHTAAAGTLIKPQHVMRDADSHAAALGPAQSERC